MDERDCTHENVLECEELVCRDCGLVLGQVFHHQQSVEGGGEPSSSKNIIRSFQDSLHDSTRSDRVKNENDAVFDAVSNALARLFLDSDQIIAQAVSVWNNISSYKNVNTERGRRELAFVLWKTLMDNGVIREKSDLESVCGAEPNSMKNIERKKKQPRIFKRASSHVDTLGAWLGLPFQHRRLINKYIRSFDLQSDNKNNRLLLSRSSEVLAGTSILFIYNQLRKKAKFSRVNVPEYMKGITPENMANLIAADRNELKLTYKMLPRDIVLEKD